MKRSFLVILALAGVFALSGCDDKNTYDGHYTAAFIIIGIIVLLFLFLAGYTNMLRDEISDCAAF